MFAEPAHGTRAAALRRSWFVLLPLLVVVASLQVGARVARAEGPGSRRLAGTGIERVRTEVAGSDGRAPKLVVARTIGDRLDSRSAVDIRSVQVDRDGDVARFRITTADAFETPYAPCLSVQAGLRRIGYRICGSGGVIRTSSGARVAIADVARPTPRSVDYTFGKDAVGSPSFYRWRAIVFGSRCRGPCDLAPNDGWITFRDTVTYRSWADAFLGEIDAPVCTANRLVLVTWMVAEGAPTVWNPLATTYEMPGNLKYNSHGVKHYPHRPVGLEATWLTLERGWRIYDYAPIVRKLRNCKPARATAKAIRRSSWCAGCVNGRYVVGLISTVRAGLDGYASRKIATAL